MLKKDYIIRLTEEFGKFLGILMGLRKKGEWKEFEIILNEMVIKFTGTEIVWVENLRDENFIIDLTENNSLTNEKLKMLGDLLYEKGMLYSSQNNLTEAKNCFNKSYAVFIHLKNSALDSDFSLDMHYKISLLERMRGIK